MDITKLLVVQSWIGLQASRQRISCIVWGFFLLFLFWVGLVCVPVWLQGFFLLRQSLGYGGDTVKTWQPHSLMLLLSDSVSLIW